MIANETYSIDALRWFKSTWGNYVMTFDGLLAYYRAQGVFMDRFGAAIRPYDQQKMKRAMEKLGRSTSTLPPISDFFTAAANEVGSLSFSEVASAGASGALDGVKAIGETAIDLGKSSLMIYVAVAAFGVFILPKLLAKGALGK